MAEWTQADRSLAIWSARGVAVLGVIYVLVGIIGVVERPPGLPPLRQVDPYLAILEFLIILSAAGLVVLMAAVYAYAPPGNKTYALVALSFMIAFAVLTWSTHFASLTVGRQIAFENMPWFSRQLSFGEWPTLSLSLDLLGWDFLLGFSLLFAAPVFWGDPLQNIVRITMYVDGALCLSGTLGPLSGHMWLQFPAIVGYAFVLPVLCVLLAVLFARSDRR